MVISISFDIQVNIIFFDTTGGGGFNKGKLVVRGVVEVVSNGGVGEGFKAVFTQTRAGNGGRGGAALMAVGVDFAGRGNGA